MNSKSPLPPSDAPTVLPSLCRRVAARFAAAALRFHRHQSGNVAVIFSISLLPILGLIGAAIDYTRVNNARTAMQSALDSAALMISKDVASGSLDPSQITPRAQAYFKALYDRPEAPVGDISVLYTPNDAELGSTVQLKGTGQMATNFVKVIGFPTLDFNADATTAWGNTRLRVAMALDNTGSMRSAGKMSAMQVAAKGLIDQLKTASKKPGDVYVSIIPFSKDVNAGPSNVNAGWMSDDWSYWESEPVFTKPRNWQTTWANIGPGSTCPWDAPSDRRGSFGFTCTIDPANGAFTTATIPSSGPYKGYICPSVDSGRVNTQRTSVYYNGCYDSVPTITNTTTTVGSGSSASCNGYANCTCTGSGRNKVCQQTTTTEGPPYKHNWIVNNRSTWNGCVTDRNQNYDTTADPPTTNATKFTAEQYSLCTSQVTPLSDDWEALKRQIDEMVPNGNTNQGIGMAWGWLSLLQQAPMNAPAEDPDYHYNRVVILLSDGDNTQNRFSKNAKEIDGRQKTLCANAKAAGIKIFTIQVNTDGTATSDVMKDCASSPDNFYPTTSSGGIASAFQGIGASLSKLRIAR